VFSWLIWVPGDAVSLLARGRNPSQEDTLTQVGSERRTMAIGETSLRSEVRQVHGPPFLQEAAVRSAAAARISLPTDSQSHQLGLPTALRFVGNWLWVVLADILRVGWRGGGAVRIDPEWRQ
jgi:hypothetical protein